MYFVPCIVFGFFAFLVSKLCSTISKYYIEKQKYITLQSFVNCYDELTHDDLLSFIDSLHFDDIDKSLISLCKVIYDDLRNSIHRQK